MMFARPMMFAPKETNMKTNLEPQASVKEQGFTLLELMVALVVTLVITGSMWGLMASGQGSFRREPVLMDRQQQIRIAMTRIQEDVRAAGLGLGNFVQAFGENLNGGDTTANPANPGMLGVRVVGDPNLGGGLSDFLEIRMQAQDCPQVRITNVNGANLIAANAFPACYPEPGWVLAIYPDGNAKWGWGHNQHGNGNAMLNFPPGQQPPGSQMDGVQNITCSLDLAVVPGNCPGANGTPPNVPPVLLAQMDRIRYQLGNDTDGVPALFRSASGGWSGTAGNTNQPTFSNPPGAAWQLVARGIEDMQIRYRTFAGWQNNAPQILPTSAAPFDNIVREVEVTLWARTVGENQLQGQTVAAGNGVTAVRGSLVTSISPRAAQISLMQELDPNKRWQ